MIDPATLAARRDQLTAAAIVGLLTKGAAHGEGYGNALLTQDAVSIADAALREMVRVLLPDLSPAGVAAYFAEMPPL